MKITTLRSVAFLLLLCLGMGGTATTAQHTTNIQRQDTVSKKPPFDTSLKIRINAMLSSSSMITSKGLYMSEVGSPLLSKAGIGYRFGAELETPLGSRGWYLAPGFFIIRRGWNLSTIEKEFSRDMYTDNLLAQVHFGKLFAPYSSGVSLYVQGGAFITYGVGGKVTYTLENKDGVKMSIDRPIYDPPGNEDPGGLGLYRVDFGFGALFGVNYKRFTFQYGFDCGFVDHLESPDVYGNMVTTYLSAGVRF